MADFLQALAGGMRSGSDAAGRQYGAISGIVVDVDDPDRLARVRVRLKGMDTGDSTDWLSPMLPGSIESVPALEEAVVVFPVDGDYNRALYTWHPQSKTRNRPTEALSLGTTHARLYNHVVDLINEIRSDFNAHTHTVSVTGTIAVVGAGGTCAATGTAATSATQVTTAAAGKSKAADGSTPSAIATDTIALSGTAKVK